MRYNPQVSLKEYNYYLRGIAMEAAIRNPRIYNFILIRHFK